MCGVLQCEVTLYSRLQPSIMWAVYPSDIFRELVIELVVASERVKISKVKITTDNLHDMA